MRIWTAFWAPVRVKPPLKMLFVFLVDDDVEMKSSILGPSKDDSSNFPFQATCLDGALYFVEYFSKVGRG